VKEKGDKMYGDIIECLNCGKTFKDTTNKTDKLTEKGNTYQWKGQDSREGNFKNMCPYCLSTSTKNTHKKAKNKTKFIYDAPANGEERHKKGCPKKLKKPNLDNEVIAKKVLGWRQPYNLNEDKRDMSKVTGIKTFVNRTKSTFLTQITKSFTPQELMERKLKAQHIELLSPPDNYRKYRGWRYDKRLKHGRTD